LNISAYLVDAERNLIRDGFCSGDVRTLKIGQSKIEFPGNNKISRICILVLNLFFLSLIYLGLKLNKMTPIKQQVRSPRADQTHQQYLIMFQFGETCLFSRPFTIVSSTKQLSEDMRTIVRPRASAAGILNFFFL
jgi:hypothetical protein